MAATAVVEVVVASHLVGGGGEEAAEWEGATAEIRTVVAMEKAQVQSTTATLLAHIRITTHLHRRATTPHSMAQHSSQQLLQVVHMDLGCCQHLHSLNQLHRQCMVHKSLGSTQQDRTTSSSSRRVTVCTPTVQPLLPHPLQVRLRPLVLHPLHLHPLSR